MTSKNDTKSSLSNVATLWNFRQFYLTFNYFEQFSTHRVENLCCSHLHVMDGFR